MKDEINLSEVTAAIANQQISDFKKWATGEIKRFWMKNISSFRDYSKLSFDRYSKTKTLLYKDSPVKVADLYVPTSLKDHKNNKKISDIELIRFIEKGNPALITATAGSGKTFFAKYIFLKSIQRSNCIPIMIELRNVINFTSGIIDILVDELVTNDVAINSSILKEMISTGRFIIILDGYDEIESSKYKSVNEALLHFISKFPNCPLVVTSRPDDKLEYLAQFNNYQVLPLQKKQAIALVEKLKYDETVKHQFILNLKKDLYSNHKDFIGNPLLLTILLLTYSEIAEIPSKMHIFYDQAFDVLFCKHDASKGMYRREVKSGLAIDDFKDILACVSASGYVRQKITLTNSDLISYIRKAKKLTGINKLSPELYKTDLLTTVCMLVQDGLKYSYNHRSFQEYFAAYFITKFEFGESRDIYWKFLERGAWDNALFLAYEMNREGIETHFIYPVICQLLDEIDDDPVKALKAWCKGFNISWRQAGKTCRPSYVLLDATPMWNFVCYLETLCRRNGIVDPPKFRNILTKKNLEKILPDHESSIQLLFSDLDPESLQLLHDGGLIKSVHPRILFLEKVKAEIEKRINRRNSQNVEKWL